MSAPGTRIAVIGTPRSGNTWLRHLIASLAGVAHDAVHHPDDVPWGEEDVVVQVHWLPEDDFVAALHRHGFRVVTIARHPLDVFISIVQYVRQGRETGRWLAGAGGDEERLAGGGPTHPESLAYVESERFAALLSVTAEWWRRDGVVTTRYEQLVADPEAELHRVAAELGLDGDVRAAVEANTMTALRHTYPNRSFHFWTGQPGLWRTLLPAEIAERMTARNRQMFETLGYVTGDWDSGLDTATAERNWYRSDSESLAAQLHDLREVVDEQRKELAQLQEMGPTARKLAVRLTRLKATLVRR